MDFCWTEYMKTEEQNWKENHGIQNIGTEESKGNITVDVRQVLKILENYSTEPYDRTKWPADLEFELEEEVDADKRGPYNWQSEDEKVVRDKKARRDDDVPRDVLKLLGEDGLRIMKQLLNDIYETGKWSKDFT